MRRTCSAGRPSGRDLEPGAGVWRRPSRLTQGGEGSRGAGAGAGRGGGRGGGGVGRNGNYAAWPVTRAPLRARRRRPTPEPRGPAVSPAPLPPSSRRAAAEPEASRAPDEALLLSVPSAVRAPGPRTESLRGPAASGSYPFEVRFGPVTGAGARAGPGAAAAAAPAIERGKERKEEGGGADGGGGGGALHGRRRHTFASLSGLPSPRAPRLEPLPAPPVAPAPSCRVGRSRILVPVGLRGQGRWPGGSGEGLVGSAGEETGRMGEGRQDARVATGSWGGGGRRDGSRECRGREVWGFAEGRSGTGEKDGGPGRRL